MLPVSRQTNEAARAPEATRSKDSTVHTTSLHCSHCSILDDCPKSDGTKFKFIRKGDRADLVGARGGAAPDALALAVALGHRHHGGGRGGVGSRSHHPSRRPRCPLPPRSVSTSSARRGASATSGGQRQLPVPARRERARQRQRSGRPPLELNGWPRQRGVRRARPPHLHRRRISENPPPPWQAVASASSDGELTGRLLAEADKMRR